MTRIHTAGNVPGYEPTGNMPMSSAPASASMTTTTPARNGHPTTGGGTSIPNGGCANAGLWMENLPAYMRPWPRVETEQDTKWAWRKARHHADLARWRLAQGRGCAETDVPATKTNTSIRNYASATHGR